MNLWWKTRCCYCGEPIMVQIPVKLVLRNRNYLKGNSCYKCIPEFSIVRNGVDEHTFKVKPFVQKRG